VLFFDELDSVGV